MLKVYVAKCGDYDQAGVNDAITRGIKALGGMDFLLGGRQNIAVKPNLLQAHRPMDCATTHPAVVQGILEAVIKSGRKATIVESPAGMYSALNLKAICDMTGMTKAAKNAGAALNRNFEVAQIRLDNAQAAGSMRIIKAALDSDCVISAAKLKTHTMMVYTGAVKNLFGVVPGLSKVEYHFRFPNTKDFANMIVDIAEFVKPPLSVIDGIWAMEGEGPVAGNVRKIGVIILSDSPYAADIVAGRIIGLSWRDNPVIKCAVDRKIIDPEDIEVLGDDIDDLAAADFIKPEVLAANILRGRVPLTFEKILNKWLVLYPTFDASKCTGCGTCERSCPAAAINIKNGLPEFDRHICINCFCCSELCPKKAIGIYRPLVLRAAEKIFK